VSEEEDKEARCGMPLGGVLGWARGCWGVGEVVSEEVLGSGIRNGMRYAQEAYREKDMQREDEEEAERCVDEEGIEWVGYSCRGEVVDQEGKV
jgi:hypothetical protein